MTHNRKPKKPTKAEVRRLEANVLVAADYWNRNMHLSLPSTLLALAVHELRAAKARAAK